MDGTFSSIMNAQKCSFSLKNEKKKIIFLIFGLPKHALRIVLLAKKVGPLEATCICKRELPAHAR